MRFAVSEPDDYGIVDPLKEAEEARLQAWDQFVSSMHAWGAAMTWAWVLEVAAVAMRESRDPEGPVTQEFVQFAEEHGWPDTLRAIAQALQADERHKRELMDRR